MEHCGSECPAACAKIGLPVKSRVSIDIEIAEAITSNIFPAMTNERRIGSIRCGCSPESEKGLSQVTIRPAVFHSRRCGSSAIILS